MTKKKSVNWLWERLRKECFERRSQIYDDDKMVFLGFSTQSWRVWKPRLLEMTTKYFITRDTKDGEVQEFVIRYDREAKFWECILLEYA